MTTTSSFLVLGMYNPFLGATSFMILRLLENTGTTNSLSSYAAHRWLMLSPEVWTRIKIATYISTAVGIILIGTLFVPKSENKSVFSGFVPQPVRLAKIAG